jgi:hypothetical protein
MHLFGDRVTLALGTLGDGDYGYADAERVKLAALRHAREEIAVAYHDRLVCWIRNGEVLDCEGIGIVGCT